MLGDQFAARRLARKYPELVEEYSVLNYPGTLALG